MDTHIPQDPDVAALAVTNFARGTQRWTEDTAPLPPPDQAAPAATTEGQ